MTTQVWTLAALAVAAGCTVPNTEHCLHQKPDGHSWCAEHHLARPLCSPCAAANDGCVTQPPTSSQCPEYEAPDGASESGSDGSGTSGTSTGTGTGSDTTTTAADPSGGARSR